MATYQRLLNPVYNHLDNGNPAKALKECDQILRKQSKKNALPTSDPIWQNTNSLKAIALQRLNRIEEALELANRIRETQPSDEATLQMVSNIYRDCHQPQFIPTLYENALKKQESEDLYTHTFMAYLRNENFMQMKLIGAKLFQKYKQYPYLYWSAMAGYLQGVLNQPEMKKMNLTLARRYIEKELDKVDNERQIKLYLMILDELEDDEEIEKVLTKYESLFTQTLFGYKERMLALWERKGCHGQIASEMTKDLTKDDNDWAAWRKLISTVFTISQNQTDLKLESTDRSTVTSIPVLIQYVTDKCISCRSRGPHLAKFETIRLLNGVPEHWGSLSDVFINYCHTFRSKSSTFFDLETFFILLNNTKQDVKVDIINQLISTIQQTENYENQNLDAICCNHLLPYQLWLNWRADEDVDISVLVKFALNMIAETSELENIKRLMPTEPRPWDRHFLVAAQLLLAQQEQVQLETLVKALAILELGIAHTGKNSDLMLMALNLYAKIGCVSKGIEYMKSLDIKSIQYDSIGYVAFPVLARLDPEESSEVMENATSFYVHSNKDATDMIIKCYQNGNFDKILDMMQFRDAILNSGMRRLTITEFQILSYILAEPMPLELFPDNTTDNRDLDALHLFSSDRSTRIEEIKRDSFDRNGLWLRFRECQLVVMVQLLENDVVFTAPIIEEKLSELSTLIPLLAVKSNSDEMLRAIIGIHDPVNLPDDAAHPVLALIQSTLTVAYQIKKMLLSEKGTCGQAFTDFTDLISQVNVILSGGEDNDFFTRWFVAEVVMIFERTLRSVMPKVKALRRKNGNKLNKNIKDLLTQMELIWQCLATLETTYTQHHENTTQLDRLNLESTEINQTNGVGHQDQVRKMMERVGRTVEADHSAIVRRQNEYVRKTMIHLENILLKK